MRIAVSDFVTNTNFPVFAAEELGFFKPKVSEQVVAVQFRNLWQGELEAPRERERFQRL
jgi:hypothetical protein